MFNFVFMTKENIMEQKPNWSEIPHHYYRILTAEGSRSGKIYALLNLVSHQPDIDRICLYAKDPYEAKYQLLINKK